MDGKYSKYCAQLFRRIKGRVFGSGLRTRCEGGLSHTYIAVARLRAVSNEFECKCQIAMRLLGPAGKRALQANMNTLRLCRRVFIQYSIKLLSNQLNAIEYFYVQCSK